MQASTSGNQTRPERLEGFDQRGATAEKQGPQMRDPRQAGSLSDKSSFGQEQVRVSFIVVYL